MEHNVVKVPNISERVHIEDQASLWIAKIDRGLAPFEKNAFQQWITADPLHFKIFMSFARCWDATEFRTTRS